MRRFSDWRLVWKVLVAPAFAVAVMTVVAVLLANSARQTEQAYDDIELRIVAPIEQLKDLKDQMTLAHARLLAVMALAENDTNVADHVAAAHKVSGNLVHIR